MTLPSRGSGSLEPGKRGGDVMEGYRAQDERLATLLDEVDAPLRPTAEASIRGLAEERDAAREQLRGAVERAEKAEAEALSLRGIIERRGSVEQLAQLDRLDGGR